MPFSGVLGQQTLKGYILDEDSGELLVGASILEKGTTNGTVTDTSGYFEIQLESSKPILIVSYIGYKLQEVEVGDRTQIELKLKYSCIKCWFDYQTIAFQLRSGLINTPFGASLKIKSPILYKETLISLNGRFQTNLKGNQYRTLELGINHLLSSCNFSLDVNLQYEDFKVPEFQNMNAYSLALYPYWRKRINPIIGIKKLGYSDYESQISTELESLLGLGVNTHIGRPFYIGIVSSIYFNNKLTNYDVKLNRKFKQLNGFIHFFKIQDITELSIGVGHTFQYYR